MYFRVYNAILKKRFSATRIERHRKMNTYQITVLPYDRILNADEGENLLHVLQQNSLAPELPAAEMENVVNVSFI